jgi:hypothetical protein
LEQDIPEFPADEPLSPVPQGPPNSPPKKTRTRSSEGAEVTSGYGGMTLGTADEGRSRHVSEFAESFITIGMEDQEQSFVEVRENERPDGVNASHFEGQEPERGDEDLLAASTDSEWAAVRAMMAGEEALENEREPASDQSSGSYQNEQGPDEASDLGVESGGELKGGETSAIDGLQLRSAELGDPVVVEGDSEAEDDSCKWPKRTFSRQYEEVADLGDGFETSGSVRMEVASGAGMGATSRLVRTDSKSPKKGVLSGVASWLKRKSPTKMKASGKKLSSGTLTFIRRFEGRKGTHRLIVIDPISSFAFCSDLRKFWLYVPGHLRRDNPPCKYLHLDLGVRLMFSILVGGLGCLSLITYFSMSCVPVTSNSVATEPRVKRYGGSWAYCCLVFIHLEQFTSPNG